MVWVGFLAGIIVGIALGVMITCIVVISKKADELEGR